MYEAYGTYVDDKYFDIHDYDDDTDDDTDNNTGDDTDDDIYCLYKIPKASSKWVDLQGHNFDYFCWPGGVIISAALGRGGGRLEPHDYSGF